MPGSCRSGLSGASGKFEAHPGWAGLVPERERFASAATMVIPRLNFIFMLLETSFVACSLGDSCVLGSVYGAQELHELITDLGRGFVLYPVAHILDFEIPHETGKAGAEFFDGWIEHSQAIRLPRNEKGRLGDLRAFPSTGQIEIGFRGAVIIQATVKAGTLEFTDVMSDVIWFHP
jgi:hypothetical protein